MVEDRITDGRRIAQLLASELDGRGDGAFDALAVVDADPDVEPTADGARAYDVALVGDDAGGAGGDGADETRHLATVFVQPDRARVEFVAAVEAAAERASDADLRVRPKATDPPRTLVFVPSGAAVKRVADVFEAVAGDRD